MHNDARPNGHGEPMLRVTDARLAMIERRLGELAESGEQRVEILRTAIGDFCADEFARRDAEIAALQKYVGELERKLDEKATIDRQVDEVVKRLDARAAARDEAKRGPRGLQGERGSRGEQGRLGPRGPAGLPAKPGPSIHSWHIDTRKYSVTPFLTDGTQLPAIDLRPLFVAYFDETST